MRRITIGGLLLAAFCLLVSQTVAQQQAQHQTNKGNQTRHEKNTNAHMVPDLLPLWVRQPPPTPIIQIVSPEQHLKGSSCSKDGSANAVLAHYWCVTWSNITPEQMTALFTVILSIATIALWVATRRLASLAGVQAQDAKKSLLITKQAADAATVSANVAKSTLIGTEAPFLFPNFEWSNRRVIYRFQNVGKSPAIVREIYFSCVSSQRLPDPIPFPPLQSPLHMVEIIPPGGQGKTHSPQNCPEFPTLEQVAAEALYGHRETSFMVGQVRYTDVFGNQFLTGFCYALNIHTQSFYGIGGIEHNFRRTLTDEETHDAESRDSLAV